MHFAHIYLCIKLHISLCLIVIWNCTRAYMHTMHAQFEALIAFFGNLASYAHSLCVYLWSRDQSVRCEHSDGWQDRKVCFTDIQHLTASHCSTEAHLADVPFPRSFDSRLVLRQSCSGASVKSRWMWMQKNTPVPRLNKGFSCQEKGDKNCFEQGGQA